MPSARKRGAGARTHTLLAILLVLLGLGAPPASADSLAPPTLTSPTAFSQVKANPTFTWNAVPRAAKYQIQISSSATFSGTPAPTTLVVYGTTATPTVELPLGKLYWHVRSIDGGGEPGVYSDTQEFDRVLGDAPVLNSPADLGTINYPEDPAVLSWQAVPGMTKYLVQLDDESTFTGALEYETANTSLALPVALPSNAPRFWRVQGVSTTTSVTTAWSDTGDLRKFSISWAPTARPTLLAPADDVNVDIDDFEFSWTAVPGAARYQIQTSTDPDFDVDLTSALVHGTRYRPTNSITQEQYFWRVRALQSNGEPSQWSDASQFKREWLDGEGHQARPELTLEDHDGLELGNQLEFDNLYFSWTPIRRASYYEIHFLRVSNSTSKVCKSAHPHFTPYLNGTYTGTPPSGFGACVLVNADKPEDGFLVPGESYIVKVRAVEQTPSGATRTSLWSDTAREGEGSAPGLQFFKVLAQPDSGTPFDGPGVITSSPNSGGSPHLSWERVQGAVTYTVVLARDSNFNSRVGQFETTGTDLVINQMLLDSNAGQSYFWFVLPCVKNADNQTVCTLENTAINIPGKYATFSKLSKPVEGLTADPVQTDTVALAWQDYLTTLPDTSGIKWYEVEVRNASDALVDEVLTDATGYSPLDEAYPDGRYSWRVQAIDASGTGLGWGNGPAFDVQSSTPVPQAPAAGSSLPVLRWSPTSFAGSYEVEVYRGVDPSFPSGSKIAPASATGLRYPAYAPRTVLAAGTYSWRVRQLDVYGNAGPWSSQVLPFSIGGTKPDHVSPAHQSFAPVPSLVFDWSDVAGAVRYRLETSVQEGFGTIYKSITTTENRYAPIDAYTGGTLYWWRVHALNANGDTLATSAPTSFTAQTTPAAPAATATRSGTQIQVSWIPPASGGSDINAYYVRMREVGTTEWDERDTAGNVTSLTFGELKPNTAYEAQVAAANAIGTGPFAKTNPATVTTPTVPTAPSSLTLTPDVRKLTATWRAPSNNGGMPVTGYVVKIVPTAGGIPVEQAVTGLTATFEELADETSYTVEVAAKNEVGTGSFASGQASTLPLPDAPDTTIAGTDGAHFKSQTVSFTFSSTPAANSTFECKLDTGSFEPCTSPHEYTELIEGSHVLEVRATDAYGQTDGTPAVRNFTVDLTPPETAIVNKPALNTAQTTATFTYEGTPGADTARFECKLDTLAYAPCDPTGKTYTNLGTGRSHTFEVRAIDLAGNADPTPATYTWTIDTSAPNTTIPTNSGPANNSTVASRSAEFTFTSEVGATFECQLDAGEYAACTSPVTYTELADGSHTFSVRAIDAAGNVDATPATRTWKVDATPPDTNLTGGPAGSVKLTTAAFTFTSEAGAKFECQLDEGAYAACASGKSYSGLSEGEHTFRVRAVDAVGNVDATPATRTWRVDLTPPDTAIGSAPAATTNATDAEFAFTSEEGATFECKLDAGAYAPCTSPKTYTGLAAGTYTFTVRAVDAAGNVDPTPVAHLWTVDLTPPNTTITGGPNGPVRVATASFAFSSEAGATFECKLDGGAFEACTSPRKYEQLGEGAHTFAVRARDAAGNLDDSPAERSFVVDLTPPDTSITGAPSDGTTDTAATFTYAGKDALKFECRLDGALFGECQGTGRTYTGLAAGAHTFEVRAVDAAGNADPSPAKHAWTIATPPAPPAGSGAGGGGTETPAPAPTPAPTATPGPDSPPAGDVKEQLAEGLLDLPSRATAPKTAKSFSFTLPANAFPAGTVLTFKVTADSKALAAKAVTIGSGRVTVKAGAKPKVTIKLGSKARKVLKRKKKLKIRLSTTATAGGVKSTRAKSLTLKLKR